MQLRWTTLVGGREWPELSESCDGLRSSVTDWSAEDLWGARVQLTETEVAFRVLKLDLAILPVFLQQERRAQAPSWFAS